MARERYIWDREQQKLVTAQEYWASKQSSSSSHFVHQDSMDPLLNHGDGRVYDSKSEFRKAIKAMGCIEFGNEKLPERKPPKPEGVRQELARNYEQLSSMSAGERANYINSLK